MHACASAGNVLQYVQLASVLVQAGQYNEAEALLHQLLLHVETVKVCILHYRTEYHMELSWCLVQYIHPGSGCLSEQECLV